MYRDNTIAVVIPAFNEEAKIKNTILGIPAYVDQIYAINDCSTDRTEKLIEQCADGDPRISCVTLKSNSGVGAAIVCGYSAAITAEIDIAVVMAGDGQMDPEDLPRLLNTIVDGVCDYSKGNRFLHHGGVSHIPIQRLVGNMVLSILTKIISGYWHISDSQCGYTAINQRALNAVEWEASFPGYGCPNDYLVRLNIANMRVADVPVRAIYGPQWSSHLRITRVIGSISKLMLKLFLHRLFRKYVVKNSHPIILNYLIVFLCLIATSTLACYIAWVTATSGIVPKTALILFVMFLLVKLQLLFSAFEMDYRLNEHLFAVADPYPTKNQ